MEFLAIVAVSIISTGAMLVLAWYFLSAYLKREAEKNIEAQKTEWQKIIAPIRIQAYERLILFLERITPEQLILRTLKPGMTAQQLQMEMVKSIRDEFTHNLSQQLYISDGAWEVVKTSKEEMIQLINMSMGRLGENATARDLSTAIFEATLSNNYSVTEKSISYLKEEVRKFF